jgi:hypothetical protein
MKGVTKVALDDGRLAELHTTGKRTHLALNDDRAPEDQQWTVTIVWRDGHVHCGQGASHKQAYDDARMRGYRAELR